MPNIYFPHLNLYFNINSIAFKVFGLPVYWYGIILTTGIVLGTALASYIAKKENLDSDIIIDFILYDIIFALIGARAYYVAFNFGYYKDNLIEIFNIRQGGIAIYGAVIISVIVAVVYTRKKKLNFWKFADIAAYGLVLGQAIGRYGNFVNKEAFGDYTNSIFAMRILKQEAKLPLSENILSHLQTAFGGEYIQVHPTFFYESCWNIVLLALLFAYRKYRKADGEIFLLYLIGYGVGRFWIEGLRTDQLLIGTTHIAISQVVAILSIILGIIGIIMCRKLANKE
ncbi:MAG: prolipoprotein diacylglyceryl transferase [Clostridia bacterium]|jgi:phosphatidylglycerol:prolipoprotein diacylglycerol transferase|nr:prolipoprotein diacylglyceryl transferase [Clostridia bacterium]